MMRRTIFVLMSSGIVTGISLGQLATAVRADSFELRAGGTISGTLLNDLASEVLKIKTSDGVTLEIPKSKLKTSVVLPTEQAKIYSDGLSSREDSVELHKALSQLCLQQSQSRLAFAHRERVVELAPTDQHWGELSGYFKDEITGEWGRVDRINQSKGMIQKATGKGWDTPQSQAIAEVEKKRKIEKMKMAEAIDRALKNSNQVGPRGLEAAQFLQNLNDPVAIDKIADLLKKDIANGGTGEHWMDMLAKMPLGSATSVYIELATNSLSIPLVDQCLEILNSNEFTREAAFDSFMQSLGSKEVKVIERAASNIQAVGDKRAIPKLIIKLVSLLKRTITTPGVNAVSNDGSVAQTQGPITRTFEDLIKHQAVLSALISFSGENFQFDQKAWSYWYAHTYAKENLDLRRDP